MIVCSCNVLTDKDFTAAIKAILAEDPWAVIVPGRLMRELGKRGKCCQCFPNIIDLILKTVEEHHAILKIEGEPEYKQKMLRLRMDLIHKFRCGVKQKGCP